MVKFYVTFDTYAKWFDFTRDLLLNKRVTHVLAEREKLSVAYMVEES
jgi:hypothetical protein